MVGSLVRWFVGSLASFNKVWLVGWLAGWLLRLIKFDWLVGSFRVI